jgi:hypothetical protein
MSAAVLRLKRLRLVKSHAAIVKRKLISAVFKFKEVIINGHIEQDPSLIGEGLTIRHGPIK